MEGSLLSLTLTDVQITTQTLAPLFEGVKSAFWFILTPILVIYALKLAAWVIPVLFNKISKR